MKYTEFDNDIKNITIIFVVICFIFLYFKGLHSDKIHQKELNRVYGMVATSLNVIKEQDSEIDSLTESLQSMNSYADYLEERLSQVGKLNDLIQDLGRSWREK